MKNCYSSKVFEVDGDAALPTRNFHFFRKDVQVSLVDCILMTILALLTSEMIIS